jgi:hypothetical protein
MNQQKPALPGLDGGLDPRVARLMAPIKEIIETREGLRGDPLERHVTLADLVNLGLVSKETALGLRRTAS